jgi:hypothetical protein
MDYLDHLGRVANKQQRKVDIANLEQQLGYELPKLLKTFYLIYQVNDLKQYRKGSHLDYNYLVWNDVRKYSSVVALFVSDFKELGYDPETFYEFKSIPTVIEDWFNDDYKQLRQDYMVVGETSWHFPLMVGISTENSDMIFVYDMDNRELKYLADNIFEYLMNIELDFSNNYNLPEGKTVNDLYKNWGEDFWRVREENS